MSMIDWNTYRDQLFTGVGEFGKLRPDTLKGYGHLSRPMPREGALDAKTRELVAVAVAVSLRCDGCIATHASEARKAGATREDLAEALAIAVAINAGAAMVYSTRTLDAFAAAAEA